MKYYTAEQAVSDIYIKFPKWLIPMDISSDAKLLYVYLLDRHKLSLKNKWIDDNNHVYLNFTRAAMQEVLGCSKTTAIKAAKALEEVGLIEEKRVPNKPSRIYLLMPSFDQLSGTFDYDNIDNEIQEDNIDNNRKSKKWTSKNYTSGSPNSIPPEVQKLDPNKNNSSKTNKSKNNLFNDDDIVNTSKIVGEDSFDNSVVVEKKEVIPSSISFSEMTQQEIKKVCYAREKAIRESNESYDAFTDPKLIANADEFPEGLIEFNEHHKGKLGIFPFDFKNVGFYWVRSHDIYRTATYVKEAEELVKNVMLTFPKIEDRLALTLINQDFIGKMIEDVANYYADYEYSEIKSPRSWCAGTLRNKIAEIKMIYN